MGGVIACVYCLGVATVVALGAAWWMKDLSVFHYWWGFLSPVVHCFFKLFLVYVVAVGHVLLMHLGMKLSLVASRADFFEACVFIKRKQLRAEGFFDPDNAQKGPHVFPRAAQELLSLSDRAFSTFAKLALGNCALWTIGACVHLSPIDQLVYKSGIYATQGVYYLLFNAEFFNILRFDLVKIVDEPLPAEDPDPQLDPGVDFPVAFGALPQQRNLQAQQIRGPLPQLNPAVAVNQPEEILGLPADPPVAVPAVENLQGLPAEVLQVDANLAPNRLNANFQPLAHQGHQLPRIPQNGLPQRMRQPRFRPVYPISNVHKHWAVSQQFSATYQLIFLLWAFISPAIGAITMKAVYRALASPMQA